MRLEDMEKEFPRMPLAMRTMVEQEVEKQIKTTSVVIYKKRKGLARKTFIAALVAVMALGTTVFAGVAYHMHSEFVGNYAVQAKMEGNAAGENAGAEGISTEETAAAIEIPAVKMETGYLPEGMVEVEQGKYCYEDALYEGGVSVCLYRMDTGDSQFDMIVNNVLYREDITLGGHDGVYLELSSLEERAGIFDKRIYVAYTDVHYVMEMFAAQNVTKEDAIKIAENIKLTPAEDEAGEAIMSSYSWSSYIASLGVIEERDGTESATAVDKACMENTHVVGESFSLAATGYEGLTGKVSDVQLAEDIRLLDLSKADDDLKEELLAETDADGTLLDTTIYYIKYGDGINTVDEVVNTKEVSQKLVYVTVEYTNTGDTELTDILFYGSLLKLTEDGDEMKIYAGEEPEADDNWDTAQLTGAAAQQDMYYYDVHGGERQNNYIASLQPGETVTVHMGWLVPEEELGFLYLNLDTMGVSYEFSDTALALGYVDIRQ